MNDPVRPVPTSAGLSEPAWVRRLLIGIVVLFLGAFLFLPLAVVFHEALRQGLRVYWNALSDPAALAALKLTLFATVIAVIGNTVFGLAAAWLVTRFRFPGKTLLVSLIDLPFAVSPVIAGLILVLIFGAQGWLGPWLRAHDWQVIFATPGIVLATIFVTFPFVARELIPVMQAVGHEEEQAALSLGASSWTMFWRVTLPNVKWGLLYGVILCSARAVGEFGAVVVISGNIRGVTATLPLHIENLFNDTQFAAAFAVASLLTLLAVVTLVIKTVLESRLASQSER